MNDIVEEIKLFKAQQQEEDTVETESYDITELIDCVNLHAYMIKESFEYENLTVDELEFYIESTLETIREEADTETDSLVDGVEEAYENNKTNPSKTVFIDPDAIETMKDFRDFKRELNSGNVKNKYKRLANDVPSFIPKSLQVPDYWKTPSAKLKEKESLLDASKRTRKELDELKERIDKKGHTVDGKDLTDLDNFIVDNLSDAHKGQLKRLKSIKASDGGFGKRYKMEYFGDTDLDFLDIYYESDNGTADDAKQGIIKTIINKIKAFVQRLIQRYKMWRGKKYTEKIEKSLKDPQMREKLSKKKISGKYIIDDTVVNYIKEAHDLLSGLYDNHQNIDAYANKLDNFSKRFLEYYDNTWKVTEKTDNVLHQYELAKELTPLLNHMMIAMGQTFCGEYLEPTKDDKDVMINKFGEYAGQRILTFLNRIWMITDMVQKDIRYSVTYFNSQNPEWVGDKPNNSVNNSSELEDVPDLTPSDDFTIDDFDDPGDLDDLDDDNPQDPTNEYAIEDYYMADPFLEMMQVDLYQESDADDKKDGIGSKIKTAIQALIAKIKYMIKTFRAKRTVAYIDKMKNIIHDTKKAEKAKKKMSKKSWNHDIIMAVLSRCDIIVKSWDKTMSNNQPADVVDQIYDEIIKSFESIKDIKYEYSDQPISLYQFCIWCVEEYNSLGVLMTSLDYMDWSIKDEYNYVYDDEHILNKACALFNTIFKFIEELMVGNQKIINSVSAQLSLDPFAFKDLVSDGEPPKDDTVEEFDVDDYIDDMYMEASDDAKQGIIKTIINKIKEIIQRIVKRYKMWRGKKYVEKIEKVLNDPKLKEKLSKKQVSGKHLLDEETNKLLLEFIQLWNAIGSDSWKPDIVDNKLTEWINRSNQYIANLNNPTNKTDNLYHQYEIAGDQLTLIESLCNTGFNDQQCIQSLNPDDPLVGEELGKKYIKAASNVYIICTSADKKIQQVLLYRSSYTGDKQYKLASADVVDKIDNPNSFWEDNDDDDWDDDLYNEGVDIMSNYESYETDDITIDDVDAYIESMTDNLNNAKALRDQMVQEETEYEDYKCEFVNTNDFVFESDTEELLTDAEFFDESYEPDNSPLINASNNCIQFYQEFTLAELMGVGAIIGGCIAMIQPFLDLKKFGRFPKDLMRVFEIVKSENFEASENKKALKKALKAVSKDLNYLTGPYAGTATWTVNERKELIELARITNNIVHGGAYGTTILRKNKKMSDAFRVPARLKEFVEQSEKVLKLLKKRDEELDAAGVSKKYQLRTGAADAITEWMV